MEDNTDRIQSVAARSNLVATAGEFVPRSFANLQQNNGPEDLEREKNVFVNGHQAQADYYNEVSAAGPELQLAGGLAHPYGATSAHGECTGSASNFSSKSRPSAFYNGHKGYRFLKHRESRPNNSWKKVSDEGQAGVYNSSVNGLESISGAGRGGKKIVKSHQRYKNDGHVYNNVGRTNWFENNGACVHSFDYQSNHYNTNGYTNGWRWKGNYGKSEGCHSSYSGFRQKSFKSKEGAGHHHDSSSKRGQQGSFDQSVAPKNVHHKYGSSYEADIDEGKEKKFVDDAGQVISRRDHLVDMLTRGILECLVCCEVIYQNHAVWSCTNCYHVLHLKCVIKWAKSSKGDFGWRCPACQNVTNKIPEDYYCFCGKVRNPEWNHQDCPHSCGEVCGKAYRQSCPHKCILLCHPGPCPKCTATVTKSCGCGKTKKTVQCCGSEVIVCDEICGKELNCLIHACSKKCHMGECGQCEITVHQTCFCGKNHREVNCTIEVLGVSEFPCGNACEKQLTCGNHFCNNICHEGECPKCERMPDLIKFCPCGKTELRSLMNDQRKICTDPIPTCDSICGKILDCGSPEKPHTCKSKCHEGPCPVCSLESVVKCRCGHMDKMVPCSDVKQAGDVLCNKKCTKKRSCGKHKCNQMCCTGVDHNCPLPCNRFLQCGLHKCEETCHKGHCKPCLRASFEEFSCECGAEVIFPPVPCGTRRPACERPCSRAHACDHTPVHNCHSAAQCPPCTVLTKKYCHGRHELRKAVPCHQDSFSCGLPCGKDIDCGRHKCILPCHSGPCLKPGQNCIQPCTVARTLCGHICGMPCHEGPCPTDTPCKEMVRVTCECGHRFTTRGCHENTKEFQRIATAKLARKMAESGQSGQSINLNDVTSANKKISYNTLECNDECKLIERNRRLAIALQIRNPDLSAKLTPRYSEYLKSWAKRDARFCQMVHDKLTDLVQLAKQSKQKSRSYSFDAMNREKRHFIHEYCEHFGCESVAYDQEPKRNVVATALKDKSWLPSVSIIEFIRKENSPRKVPVPVIAKSSTSASQSGMELLSSKLASGGQQSEANEGGSPHNDLNDSQIDYFDWRPQNI